MQHTDNHEHHPRNNPFVRPRGDSRPIHNLPFELLSRIFASGAVHNDRRFREITCARKYELLEKAASEERAQENTRTRHVAPFHVAVSHVCRQWRHVAISTASLWTDIRLSTDTARPPYILVSLHLERSKHLPIDITIHAPSDTDSENLDVSFDTELLCSLLIAHLGRWRSIELKLAQFQHMDAFMDAISNPSTPASQLESIRLYDMYEFEVYHGATMLSEPGIRTLFNGSAPQLKHLFLFSLYVEWDQTLISAASNLTSLELFYHLEPGRPSWSEFATMLRGAPGLQKLALHHSGPLDPPEWLLEPTSPTTNPGIDVNSPIPLLYLTDFVLGSQPEGVAIDLLRKLYMPVLKTLVLDFDNEEEDYSDFVLELTRPATALTPSSKRTLLTDLERLAILNLSCQDEEVMTSMFDQLDDLKELRLPPRDYFDLDSDSMTDQLLDILLPITFPDTPDLVLCMVPQLESLFVHPTWWNSFLLRDLVQKRQDAGIPLKSLYFPLDTMKTGAWFEERVESFGFMAPVHSSNADLAFDGYRTSVEEASPYDEHQEQQPS